MTTGDKFARILEEILKLKDSFLGLEDRVINFEKSITNKVLESEDKVMGELKDLREEATIVVGYRDMISSLEDRVEKLEKHTKITVAS